MSNRELLHKVQEARFEQFKELIGKQRENLDSDLIPPTDDEYFNSVVARYGIEVASYMWGMYVEETHLQNMGYLLMSIGPHEGDGELANYWEVRREIEQTYWRLTYEKRGFAKEIRNRVVR